MKETWKPLRNYEDYLHISSFGNVKLLQRNVFNGKGIRVIPERILTPRVSNDKYQYGIVSLLMT